MNATFGRTVIAAVLLCSSIAVAETQKFTGSDSGRSPAFTVDGPWMLDWRTKSEFPLLDSSIEIRLYKAGSGEYLGEVVEMNGTGSGVKFFENAGTFQLVVVAKSLDWELVIDEISAEQAAQLKRAATGTTGMLDAARAASKLVPESSFDSWRPNGNDTLLLFADGRETWRVTFAPPCPGLASATALSFVMKPAQDRVGQYDSILLEDGHRCYFANVVPGLMR